MSPSYSAKNILARLSFSLSPSFSSLGADAYTAAISITDNKQQTKSSFSNWSYLHKSEYMDVCSSEHKIFSLES